MSLLKLTIMDLIDPKGKLTAHNYKPGILKMIHSADTVIFVKGKETSVIKAPKPDYSLD